MDEKNNVPSLIEIILYLLLAIAFFSNYAYRMNKNIDFIIMTTFLFGILSIILLYIGMSWDKDYFRAFGYTFAGSFILALGWSILKILLLTQEGTMIVKILSLLKSRSILWALLIPSIILVSYLIVKEIRK
jgi:hypothetical protein